MSPTAWLLPCDVADLERSAPRNQAHRQLLSGAGVPFTEWGSELVLRPGQFDIAVFTHPYDRERPEQLWFDRVRACVPRTVYIPYGLSVGAGRKNLSLQFAQPLQRGADLVVVRCDAERAMYAKYCPKGDRHVQVLGHPRFDRLLGGIAMARLGPLTERIGGRTSFLWNAHFSFVDRCRYGANFSTFDLLGPDILSFFAANAKRVCLVWRPHPALLSALDEQGLLRREDLPAFRCELNEAGIVLDETADHLPAFLCCDALLSDPGSFWFEYLATGRPMLPLVNPIGEPLNPEAMLLLELIGSASTAEAVLDFVRAVMAGERHGKEEREAALHHLPMLDGQAGRRVCDAIAGRPTQKPAARRPAMCLQSTRPARPELIEAMVWTQLPPGNTGPLLESVISGLKRMRAERQAEGALHNSLMRFHAALNSSIVEWVKGRPKLTRLLERVRRVR